MGRERVGPQITQIEQIKKRGIATTNTRMHKTQSKAFSLWFFVSFRGGPLFGVSSASSA
jgi:hypothetical protein